jgi:hypothetical protein
MKKIYMILSSVLFAGAVLAQSQRLVLVEEFTQASCGPCASQNPAFNALMAANTTKVVSIKYQTSWPGVDPMNAQNPTDVSSRVTYYNVTGVPHGLVDGVSIPNDCNAYVGAPACLNQSEINTAYAVPSEFTLSASHVFNTAMDSVYVTLTLTCSQNISMTTPRLRLGMVEEEIRFATPPGSNGEKEFFNVMRKMYPNAGGTTLATSWTNGQTQTFNFAISIPTYIYNKGQIGFVAWVQDDANKSVKQASWSAPLPVPNDAGVTAITGLPAGTCNTTINPTVTLKNFGTATLTNCTINYRIDNQPVQTFAWTGSLAQNATTQVVLPSITTTVGAHTFSSYTTMPNGGTDYNGINDQTQQPFVVLSSTSVAAPVMEGFVNATFPPTGWIRENPDNGPTWTRVTNTGGFGNSMNATKMDFYNSTRGNHDMLYMVPVDLSNAISPAELKFDVAYAPYNSSYYDTLQIVVSADCGLTWTQVFMKSNTVLATAPAFGSGAFTPSATQWRAETVNLNSYIGQNGVIVKFVARSGYGNNLYLDNINITHAGASVAENGIISSFEVFPNPFSSITQFSLSLAKSESVKIEILGVAGSNVISFDGSDLASGTYFVRVLAGENSITKKITLNK